MSILIRLGIVKILDLNIQLFGWHYRFSIGHIIEAAGKRCKRCRELHRISLKGCFDLDLACMPGEEISPYSEGITRHHNVISGQ